MAFTVSGERTAAGPENGSGTSTHREVTVVTGAYPAGTLFEEDMVAAIHSLVPRRSANPNNNDNNKKTGNTPTDGQPAVRRTRRAASSPSTTAARRFKPTLNCYQCVQRKTKCDRARPSCLACTRRSKPCTYNALAEILNNASSPGRLHRKRQRSDGYGQRGNRIGNTMDNDGTNAVVNAADSLLGMADSRYDLLDYSLSSPNDMTHSYAGNQHVHQSMDMQGNPSGALFQNSPSQLSWQHGTSQHAQQPVQSHLSNVDDPAFATGTLRTYANSTDLSGMTRHPFGGESSQAGDIQELIRSMPQAAQANHLISAYFKVVDPIQPFLDRSQVLADHEAFWKASSRVQNQFDMTQLALFLAMYACASQCETGSIEPSLHEKYISACHQALRLSLYLKLHSLRRCQAIFLMCQCLLTDGQAKEAWTLAGLNHRQAYSLGLHRTHSQPAKSTSVDRNQKDLLWAALLHQDSMLSCVLDVPRMFSGSYPDLLQYTPIPSEDESDDADDTNSNSETDTDNVPFLINLNRLTTIARDHNLNPEESPTLVNPRTSVVTLLQDTIDSFQAPFQALDAYWIEKQPNPRTARQGAELICIFNLYLTLALASETTPDPSTNTSEIVNAAHEGLTAFFRLTNLVPSIANSWPICHAVSYLQAEVIGRLLCKAQESAGTSTSRRRDPLLMLAKSDFDRYLDTLVRVAEERKNCTTTAERVVRLKELRKEFQGV